VIAWADEKKVIDMTQVFLSHCCPPGNPTWLLEDKDFITSILFGASCVYDEGAYISWLASFVSGLSNESEYLANKVSWIRVKKALPEIKRKRPDLYKAIRDLTAQGGER
jgi:hypothetical protein